MTYQLRNPRILTRRFPGDSVVPASQFETVHASLRREKRLDHNLTAGELATLGEATYLSRPSAVTRHAAS